MKPGDRYIVFVPRLTNLPQGIDPNAVLEPERVVPEGIAITVRVQMHSSTWEELHRRALAHEGSDDSLWLKVFAARISGSCDCRRHWGELLVRTPPDFTNYFGWTVAAHNEVNRRLDKPEITTEEALSIWGTPPITPSP